MNKQEKDIEEIKQAINGLANMYGDLAFELRKAKEVSIPDGYKIIAKEDLNNMVNLTDCAVCEMKNQERIKKQIAREILGKIMCDINKVYSRDDGCFYMISEEYAKQLACNYGVYDD